MMLGTGGIIGKSIETTGLLVAGSKRILVSIDRWCTLEPLTSVGFRTCNNSRSKALAARTVGRDERYRKCSLDPRQLQG